MASKTTSGINYLGDLTVLGTINAETENVKNETVSNNLVVKNNLEVDNTASLNTLILNAQIFRFRHGEWIPNLGFLTDDSYGDGFTPFSAPTGSWNPNGVYNKRYGYYTQIGTQVNLYYDIDINSQGVSSLSGGTPRVVGIANVPIKICATDAGEDIVADQEMLESDWPNGFAGDTPAVLSPVYLAPRTAAAFVAGDTQLLREAFPGPTTISHTFTGYELAIFCQIQFYIVGIEPPFYILASEGFGPLTNIQFTSTLVNYHGAFKGELIYFNNE